MTLRDRALEAGRRFAERHHGKPFMYEGKPCFTPSAMAARLAFASGWLAGWAAARRR